MHKTRINLTLDLREQVIPILQARLFDAVDLFTQVKQAHWNVKGPQFIALHQLFDELAEQVEAHGDDLAERITALGGRAIGTAQAVSKQSALLEYPGDIFDDTHHLNSLADRFASFGASIRGCIQQADELGDASSADLFTQISRDIDKQLWLLEAHLQTE